MSNEKANLPDSRDTFYSIHRNYSYVLFKFKKKTKSIKAENPTLFENDTIWELLVHRIFCRVTLSFSAKKEDYFLQRSTSRGKARSYEFGKMGNLVERSKR